MLSRILVLRTKYDAVAVAVADGKTFFSSFFIFSCGTVANREVYQPYFCAMNRYFKWYFSLPSL